MFLPECDFHVKIRYDQIRNSFYGLMTSNEDDLCECKICLDSSGRTWRISSWHAFPSCGNKHYGTELLRAVFCYMKDFSGLPKAVEYVWDGSNKYVLDWLKKHFGAVNRLSGVVLKYGNDDSWDAHIYDLNLNMFLNYFELV